MVVLTSELSNSSRSCASVGDHLMQPKDSSLYINVLVTSFAGKIVLRINLIFTLCFCWIFYFCCPFTKFVLMT
uniref:Uncharacterized protein n=1 Tax=Arundo donax TaxID=35708 RepID=A0A0A9ED28_ARUDO